MTIDLVPSPSVTMARVSPPTSTTQAVAPRDPPNSRAPEAASSGAVAAARATAARFTPSSTE
ncbi:hypothetical protein AB0K62_23020 [Streptomyces halstedii]|uniref:hypothetical protein n=1 Tax=Streptomyces halstedii TaxID=1944 RepID=UPI0004A94D50|nr:hypothetical protein DT87_29760 [Streptomyces sp. NTK 937]WSX34368.1 hypothetical protein OG291_01210 [Streptomyces halstedii]